MKRRAASKYRLENIARAWQVSPDAVKAAAAIMGYKFLGNFLFATRAELTPGSEFQLEAALNHAMLERNRK